MPILFNRCGFWYQRRLGAVFTNLDLELPSGLSVLLGPNGAGKSTLLALAASALQPKSGRVTYIGRDTRRWRHRRAHRRAIGFMPQHVAALPGLTVREQVAYAAWLKGENRADAWSASREALRRVALTKLAGRKSHQLSGGQVRRMALAQSLAHHADVLLLDEPTAGLDPLQAKRFTALVGDIAQDTHVVVSTHHISDVADLYETVTVLADGTVRHQGSVAAFTADQDTITAYATLVAEEE